MASPHIEDISLDSQELARYSRHILLDEIGVEGQRKLKQARVLTIGAGGLGSPAAMYLAAAGVGTLGIAEFDRVELHNLQRQIIHGTSNIDQLKSRSAKARLSDINPHVNIALHEQGLQPDNALDVFSQYDIIVDGTDNFSTRYLNNDAAYFAKKPLVYGSIFKFEGQVSLFHPAQSGPCYRCLFPHPPPPGSVPSCSEAGVFGALCGLVGSMQALEAIKHITGCGPTLQGSLLVVDTLSSAFRKLKLSRDPDCPLCGSTPSIKAIEAENYQYHCETPQATETDVKDYPLEVDVHEAKRVLDAGQATLIDVREPYEFDICSIEGSLKIPMNSIPSRIQELPRNKPLLIQCHHGGRSMNVTRYLRQNGFRQVANVAGGIEAWALEIDPSLQRY